MTVTWTLPIRPGLLSACLLTTLVASACRDASSDPMAVILNAETRGVLATTGPLPSLSRMVDEAGAGTLLAGPQERWSRSWSLPSERAWEERRAAYQEAVAPLAEVLGRGPVAASVRSLGEALDAAEALDLATADVAIVGNLQEARLHHAAAETWLVEGRAAEALGLTLHAADLLREVGPEGMGRLLLARAEGELERLQTAEPGDRQAELVRGRRLIRGARMALDAGDPLLAAQRAFYAAQLLGLDMP